MDEDEDAETVQARIDMSLAHVQEMVNAWIKPFPGASEGARVQAEVERDVEMYRKRPARLGVGAVYTPGNSDAREVARLKGRLAAKPTAAKDTTSTQQAGEDEEDGDSRSAAFTKVSGSQVAAITDRFASKKSKFKPAHSGMEVIKGGIAANGGAGLGAKPGTNVNSSSEMMPPPPRSPTVSPTSSKHGESVNGPSSPPSRARVGTGPGSDTVTRLFPHSFDGSIPDLPPIPIPKHDSEDEAADTTPTASPRRKRKRRKKRHRNPVSDGNTATNGTALDNDMSDTTSLMSASISIATEPAPSLLSSTASRESSPARLRAIKRVRSDSPERLPSRNSPHGSPGSPSKKRPPGTSDRRWSLMQKIRAKEKRAELGGGN